MDDLHRTARRVREIAKMIESWPVVVDVRLFNARGDGVTDDTPALQNTIELQTALREVVRLSKLMSL